jgi:hypothetical protein
VKRASLVPWLVALAVFGPFVAALVLYYVPADLGWLPSLPGSRELLGPPLAVPPAWLEAPPPSAAGGRYRWFLIYAKMTACDRPCAAVLERLKQVHAALASDADRVQRVYWYAGAVPDVPADRDLSLRNIGDEAGASTVRALGVERLMGGRVYVADPRGLVVVSYPADVEQKELLRDLKRLLSASGSN